MKFCKKHIAFIEKRVKDLDETLQQKILSNFIDQIFPSSGLEHIQDRIENTKSHCPVCFYKLPGNNKLREIIESTSKKTKILA